MPAKSQRQRRYLEHKFGHDWVKQHHFDKVDTRKAAQNVGKHLMRKGSK